MSRPIDPVLKQEMIRFCRGAVGASERELAKAQRGLTTARAGGDPMRILAAEIRQKAPKPS
jgi:hypothetical protein